MSDKGRKARIVNCVTISVMPYKPAALSVAGGPNKFLEMPFRDTAVCAKGTVDRSGAEEQRAIMSEVCEMQFRN